MSNVTTDDIIGHGMAAAKVALEYIASIVPNLTKATEDEQRAVLVATCACIAGLNTKLLQNCQPDVYKETQDMILRFMEAASHGIISHTPEKPEGEGV